MGHHHEHGVRAPVEVEQQVGHLPGGSGVEVAGGLVAQHEAGRQHERPRERHALPLAAGELGRPVVEPVAEADPVEELTRPRLVVALARETSVGTRTFSSTEHCGRRKWSWNTKPIARLRKAASSGSGSAWVCRPSIVTRPEDGASSVPRM